MLEGRRVLLGVSGGVAAYKAVYLARRLIEAGAEVQVVMSDAAREFVGEQSFAAVTGRPVATSLFAGPSVSPHTELGRWAEVVVVAPATANILAKVAHGQADDLLSATLLATEAPLVLAPAMHTEMWNHPATRRNVAVLEGDGHRLVGPASGALAGGDEGVGRMVEPEEILASVAAVFAGSLRDWRVLVTAGGTREPLDPVRYLGNRSSGKMGHAIAAEAARRGAAVTLVTASDLPGPAGVDTIRVETAEEMARAVETAVEGAQVAVMAAAVADFRPKAAAGRKLRRAEGPPRIVLERTPDILERVAARRPRPFLVGFAAETGALEDAVEKARRKGVDLMVANDVTAEGSGFGSDTNQVTIIYPDGRRDPWPLLAKTEVAAQLWDLVDKLCASQGEQG